MPDGHPLPEEITLNAAEARTVYLAIVLALDELQDAEARRWCIDAQRILVAKYLPDLPDLDEE
jgi:hypothetical protein